ncbi:NAD-dependent epimerase dehydratase [Phlyctema vagabunda]|uniref:NAD-dependent epimerase dehydratase n=1 Tax=Phlyctema vagabunda TaxID=108571 RepID=A0ABR4P4J8_9HELO
MPSINAPATILVTGANGFIAAHCIAHLLRSKFRVVGTVRSESKASSVLRSHSNHADLSVQIVPDVTAKGCFNQAIKGCDAVLHLAAPFGYTYKDFESELLLPSINGTMAICEAAQQEAGVKRVVLTSSFASIYDASKGLDPEKTYTEEDWCPLTYEDGKNAVVTPIAYRASKVLAEKTAWDFVKQSEVKWDLVTLCPGMVFGALLPGTIEKLDQLNTSNGIVWSLRDAKQIPDTKAPIWTSVTGLAAAHTVSLTTPAASNERFLVTDGTYDMQELADALHASEEVSEETKKRIPVGEPSKRLSATHYKVDNSKAKKVLGLHDSSLMETVIELVKQLLEMEKLNQGQVQ